MQSQEYALNTTRCGPRKRPKITEVKKIQLLEYFEDHWDLNPESQSARLQRKKRQTGTIPSWHFVDKYSSNKNTNEIEGVREKIIQKAKRRLDRKGRHSAMLDND